MATKFAGRPGATRGMEGLTLVALPTTIATTANAQKQTQRNQIITRNLRNPARMRLSLGKSIAAC